MALARELALARGVATNAAIPGSRLDQLAPLTPTAAAAVAHALRSGALTARGLHRVRRVARTIADLGGRAGPVDEDDLCLALQLRADAARLGVGA